MSAPLSEQQLAEIRADLAAVPAPPWRWIGNRGCGGPKLVTDHSGRQYLMHAAMPTDSHGDEVLDPETDDVIFGDLVFRDQRDGERYSTLRPGNSLAIGRTSYDENSIIGVDNPVARWVERSAAHAAALLAEVERLRAERDRYHTAWRRAYQRARNRGWAADRAGARSRELQTALQDCLGALLGMQMERDAALARVTELEQQLAAERTVYLAEYEADDPQLYPTLDAARDALTTRRRKDYPQTPWDWFEQDDVHSQWRTDPLTDAPRSLLLGSIMPLTLPAGLLVAEGGEGR